MRWCRKTRCAAWNGEGTLLALLKADRSVAKVMSTSQLESLFDLDYHFKQVDAIFERVFAVDS